MQVKDVTSFLLEVCPDVPLTDMHSHTVHALLVCLQIYQLMVCAYLSHDVKRINMATSITSPLTCV